MPLGNKSSFLLTGRQIVYRKNTDTDENKDVQETALQTPSVLH